MPGSRFHITATTIIMIVLTAALTVADTHIEDFTTTTYKDTVNTTAQWDTAAGELRLFPFAINQVGSYNTPGQAYGVAIDGDLAFVADQLSGLQVIDISDPANPSLLGTYDTPGSALGIAVAGDYVYVADSASGLHVFDISDPSLPALLGTYDTPGFASGVAVAGDHAFVADYSGDLQVIDISNPALPAGVGSLSTSGRVNAVAADGDYVFLADDTAGLRVVDISDPTNPTSIGGLVTGGGAHGVVVDGDFAFFADGALGLRAIDISDPTSPSLAGTYNTPNSARGVAVSGNRAFVADGTSGLQVIDISDPTNPTLDDTYNTSGNARGVLVAGTRAFVAGEASGLQVIEVSSIAELTLEGSYDTPDVARSVFVEGNHAYVADAYSGLVVLDVSNPANPTSVGAYDTPGRAEGIFVDGNHAYVADGDSGLVVLDVSNPASPTFAGTYDTPGRAVRVFVDGDRAFLAADGFGLSVLDISIPANPALLGTYSANSLNGILARGNRAFLADQHAGLLVLDISNPASPALLGAYDPPGQVFDFFVDGDHAFLTESSAGLEVIDISNPASPTLVGGYDTPDFAQHAFVAGDYVFVADGLAGLHVLDISNPANPAHVGTYDTPNSAAYVFVDGDYAFLANGTGLQVIQVFQNGVNVDDNVGQSVTVGGSADAILRVRMSTTQTSGVAWKISADAGLNYQAITPGSEWDLFTVPGTDLLWRSTHTWAGVNPTVSDLQIDWLYDFAQIVSVSDIPNDQGKQVRVEWVRSGHDFIGDTTQIVEYALYRRIDANLLASLRKIESLPIQSVSDAALQHAQVMASAGWDFITTVPVRVEDDYAVVVPTLADSTVSDGQHSTAFMVSALTATPGVFYDSPPDSGYSVDNLAPGLPLGISAAYQTTVVDLDWDDAPEADFQLYRIYRDIDPAFTPSAGNLLQETATSNYADSTPTPWTFYYKVAAVDHAGNEGPAGAAPETVSDASAQTVPARFALHAAVPNPFNPRTTLSFSLPSASRIRLTIHDVSGRLVNTLLNEIRGPGRHDVTWAGRNDQQQSVASGVYLYRVEAGRFVETKRMILLK